MAPEFTSARWMARALLIVAVVDFLTGVFVVAAPTSPFSWAGLEPPTHPEIWQTLGLAVGVHALGHALAARNPFRFWPLVLVGLLGKVAVACGFAWAASHGHMPWGLAGLVIAGTALAAVPMASILRGAERAHRAESTPPVLPLDMALSLYQDGEGTTLLEASERQPQFLVFLRHFGCTFCREALSDLSAIQEQLRAAGTRLVLVHMSSEDEACDLFDKHGLQEVTGVSDPDRVLYRAFALRRGNPTQLLGWSVWKRGFEAGVKQGHGVGWLRGDAAQMPGAFVVSRGRVVGQFVHETAADRPDYVVVAEEAVEHAEFQDGLDEDGIGPGFQDRLRDLLTADASNRG